MAVLVSLIVIAILILVNGLFVAAEFAIIGVRPSRIDQLVSEGNRAARWVQNILDDRGKTNQYVATAQLGITLASLGLGMYAEPAIAHLIEDPLHDWFGLEGTIVHTISFIVALTLVTYLHVVLGEMVPKSLALQGAERAVLALASPMNLVGKLFSIPVNILNRIGLVTLKLLRIPPPGEDSRLYTLGELELIVADSYEGKMLDRYEREMVANILDFAGESVEQVMVPRTAMQSIASTIDEAEMLALTEATPYSRLPVYEGSIDNITGMVHFKDFIRQQLDGQGFDLQPLLRQVSFVPETLPIQDLLIQFRQQRRQMAIVIGEHGGTLGLVTMEDLLEEIFGEVWDEFDVDRDELVTLAGPGHLVARGSAPLSEIQAYTRLDTSAHDVHTVGGLVWALLGERPQVGDEAKVDRVTLRVEEVQGLTVDRVSILFQDPPLIQSEEA